MELLYHMQKYLAFVKTVEVGSITHAAEALGYTQSAVSRMIADLEAQWHLTLLERSKSGVRPTADGARLLPHVQRLCREWAAMQREADALRGLESGLIRIGTFSSVATHWLPNIIRAFRRDYPGIEYELLLGDYTEIEAWIRSGRVDCGFLSLPTCPDLYTRYLEEDPLLAVLPEQHPLTAMEAIPPEALCHEPFLLLEKGAKAEIAAIFARADLSPHVQFTTWDDYAVMSMVEGGLGISILPRLILRRIPYRVVTRPLDPPASRRIGIALRDEKTAPLAVKRFLDYLDYREI